MTRRLIAAFVLLAAASLGAIELVTPREGATVDASRPVTLAWKDAEGPFDVHVASGARTVFATNVTATSVVILKLEPARDYTWTVCGKKECTQGTFRTK